MIETHFFFSPYKMYSLPGLHRGSCCCAPRPGQLFQTLAAPAQQGTVTLKLLRLCLQLEKGRRERHRTDRWHKAAPLKVSEKDGRQYHYSDVCGTQEQLELTKYAGKTNSYFHHVVVPLRESPPGMRAKRRFSESTAPPTAKDAASAGKNSI